MQDSKENNCINIYIVGSPERKEIDWGYSFGMVFGWVYLLQRRSSLSRNPNKYLISSGSSNEDEHRTGL
jgi:hypothetical protein